MTIKCQHLDRILKLAEAECNTILGVSTSELMDKVIWMNKKLSSALKSKIQSEIGELHYQKTDDRPHDPATESFICYKCKVVLVFPL